MTIMTGRKCIPFLFVFLSIACNRVEDKRFLFEAELTATHRFPMGEPFYPLRMCIFNDYLILGTLNSQVSPDYFFQAYQLSDYSYKGSFGRRGRGPGEWNNPEIVRSSSNSPYLYLFEVSSRELTAVIHKMLLDSTLRLIEEESFLIEKGLLTFMNRPIIRNDSLLVYDEFAPEAAIRVHHLHGELPVITWTYGTTPNTEQRFMDVNRGLLLANDSCVMFPYIYQDRIDIMEWNLALKESLNYQKGKPIIHTGSPDNNVKYYTGSYLGEFFLYAFYSGMSDKELQAKNGVGHTLEVFDMNGTPVYRYVFPEPLPFPFAVDERTFTLYGYSIKNGMEDYISVYPLPGLGEYLQNRPMH